MSLKARLALLLAKWQNKKLEKWKNNPIEAQNKVFKTLISKAKRTQFGKDHAFETIQTIEQFQAQVPVRTYVDFQEYIQDIIEGKSDVLWPKKPLYFAKTSGTTAGAKYIPLTKSSLKNQIDAAKMALFNYIHQSQNSDYVDGKMIFLQGSPEVDHSKAVPSGRLSGIVANFVPKYLQKNRLPSYKTNCIEDWETKVETIVEETKTQDMTLISGIPSWVQMYFEKLIEKTGEKDIKSLFPNFKLFVYGGVNYEPYRQKFLQLIGEDVDSIELFPASEGFFAFQDLQSKKEMLLLLDSGIFYEFIPTSELSQEHPTRLTIKDVEVGVDYALIISTDAGLWSYSIGDLVRFTSTSPYRIVVSGRIKHFTSAFGEHVIAYEVEQAIQAGIKDHNLRVREFHVAPEVNPESGLPYHEWFIEFDEKPENIQQIAQTIDLKMQSLNPYYLDLRAGNILKELKITPLQPNSFEDYMKSQGKLGGQNKIPRLANDRKIADHLSKFT
ncbi:MAG: GH3 auxin-responsive promoter family protein [Flavobacteriales bacterium]